MTDDVIYCGGLGAEEFVVDLRCPDCGKQECDVIEYDRAGGVERARCPGCGDVIYTCGVVPCSTMRKKDAPVPEQTPAGGYIPGEDDGE